MNLKKPTPQTHCGGSGLQFFVSICNDNAKIKEMLTKVLPKEFESIVVTERVKKIFTQMDVPKIPEHLLDLPKIHQSNSKLKF